MSIYINTFTDGVVSFYYKTDTKQGKDFLAFFVDGKCVDKWSGNNDWSYVSYTLEAGHHELEWRYDTSKNGGTEGNVCWIDDITFPGNIVVYDDVAEVAADHVSVYPNPASEALYIKGVDAAYVEIYNTIGAKVVSQNVSGSESINIVELTRGMYFVRITDNNGDVSTVKIVKR